MERVTVLVRLGFDFYDWCLSFSGESVTLRLAIT